MKTRQFLVAFGAGAVSLCVLGGSGILYLVGRGTSEVREMAPWPGPWAAPQEVAAVDLSSLGLESGTTQNARLDETWAEGAYDEGTRAVHQKGSTDVVYIWALRYEDPADAANDYALTQQQADAGACGAYAYAYLGQEGIIYCSQGDAYTKVLWHENWILEITATAEAGDDPELVVNQVCDALAEHWKVIQPSYD